MKIENIIDYKDLLQDMSIDIKVYADPLIKLKKNNIYTKHEYNSAWNLIQVLLEKILSCEAKDEVITLVEKQLDNKENKKYPVMIKLLNNYLRKIKNS